MGKTKGPYEAEFSKGTLVRILARPDLETFQRDWAYHNKLTEEQLGHAGTEARVVSVGFYHGGDELYELHGVPGVWHESCLAAVTRS